ncbi:hypothetical protein CTAYLR_004755 [Chrysophaeum taylorii]|uniref:EGF-like domain-containing protein n=1 Tax=Chrysophaeum taylorii TaxID=2483200 RepID=A0AAD7U7G2_9STRA|nr:hypothetical protein CTAYLR_004755 [Chrysophaeum taylorii]
MESGSSDVLRNDPGSWNLDFGTGEEAREGNAHRLAERPLRLPGFLRTEVVVMAYNHFLMLIFMTVMVSMVKSGYAPCPNLCSGHGNCFSSRVCQCYIGWTGADCSLRTCPYGAAWADDVEDFTGVDGGHNLAECSNRGICDRTTGICTCEDGRFEGSACERRTCPSDCNKRGRCQSMRYYSTLKDPGEGTVYTYEKIWDADMMHGCNCDDESIGPDCLLRTCPTGDDPLTGTAFDPDGIQEEEVQTLECRATSGYLVLSFRNEHTAQIPYDASESELQAYLEALTTINNDYGDALSISNAGQDICAFAKVSTTIKFLQNFGDLPLIQVDDSNLGLSVGSSAYARIKESTTGTKEDDICSNRGTCDRETGVCTCLDSMSTSDGHGNEGQRGDCGYEGEALTDCHTADSPCNLHGTCTGDPTYRCECQSGWTGADCSLMTCPSGRSWFSRPTADDNAHMSDSVAECSDMGICDQSTGTCSCMDGFEGAACNVMSCPGDPVCNSHGECLTMAQLALAATDNGADTDYTYGATPNNAETWDYDKIQGCKCDDGYEGYDCSLISCPKGDNPHTEFQDNEVQTFTCTTTDSSATIGFTFRQQSTSLLPHGTRLSELETALEGLSSITDVQVTNPSGNSSAPICSSSGSTIYIEFLSPTGDVPLITLDLVSVNAASVSESTKGTKEYEVCSGRGLCDYTTGECTCFNGFGSSDGQGNKGTLKDCGYVLPIFRCEDGSTSC